MGGDDVDAFLGQLLQEVDRGLSGVVRPHLPEIAVGTDDSPCVSKVELGQRHAKGHRIHQPAHEQQPLPFLTRQVLVQQQEVVAEVQIGFARVAIGQATAAQVVHMTRRHHGQVIARKADAPAQVNLLHVGKEVLVQPAHVLIQLAAHHQACPTCPEDALGLAVILAVVILDILKDAPAAIGVTMAIDVTARRAGIFKRLLAIVAVLEQLGHHSTQLWVPRHAVEQRVEPTAGCAHIAVEEYRVGIHRLGNSHIVPPGKPVVPVKLQQLDLGELLLQHLQAVVSAAVVGDDDVGNGGIGALKYSGQVALQELSPVPVQYDDSNLFHCISLLIYNLGVDAQVIVQGQ